MRESWRHVWEVESADEAGGQLRASLVRKREHSTKGLRSHTETLERTVLFSQCFRPLLDAVALEHYTARLQQIARYAEQGQFGCFAETRSDGGSVEVILWERSFDGADIRTEELARRAFDAGDESALVASSEFVADLQIWAERRNDERDAALLSERDAADVQARLTAERDAAGQELSQILAAHIR
jgi:hypothetical protein